MRAKRISVRRLVGEFKDGLSMIGLARKYGRTLQQIEWYIRMVMRKQKR